MALAMLFIPGIDVFAKLLGETGMSPGQAVWYRFFIQSLLLTPVILVRRLWHIPRDTVFIQFARGILLAAATLFFFAALNYLSIAEAISIFFVEPMVLTLIAALLLGETLRLRRIVAIIFGFIGALIIIGPSFAVVGAASLLPLATAVCFAFYVLLTRKISGTVSAFQMQWVVGVVAILVMSAALLFGGEAGIEVFTPSLPYGIALWWVLGLGIISTAGHLAIVFATRYAPASLLAPFQYVEIIGAVIFGYWVFGDVVSVETIIGVSLIIASGLYIFGRETRHAKST